MTADIFVDKFFKHTVRFHSISEKILQNQLIHYPIVLKNVSTHVSTHLYAYTHIHTKMVT